MTTHTTTRTGGRTRVAVAAALLLLTAACSDSTGTARGTAEPSPSSAPRGEMAFTFTAEPGEAGCRYDGPDRVGTDATSTMINSSRSEAYVTLAQLADGATPEDFSAYVATLGDEYPVRAPAADHDPSVHKWMQGGWRQVHTAAAGATHSVTSTTFAEGDYVMFCFRDAEAGSSDVWPAGQVTVAAR